MVDRVFVHIGLPKTATSYLQTIIWSNREPLRAARHRAYPATERRDHLWASRTVREDRTPASAPRSTARAWARICAGARGGDAAPA